MDSPVTYQDSQETRSDAEPPHSPRGCVVAASRFDFETWIPWNDADLAIFPVARRIAGHIGEAVLGPKLSGDLFEHASQIASSANEEDGSTSLRRKLLQRLRASSPSNIEESTDTI